MPGGWFVEASLPCWRGAWWQIAAPRAEAAEVHAAIGHGLQASGGGAKTQLVHGQSLPRAGQSGSYACHKGIQRVQVR